MVHTFAKAHIDQKGAEERFITIMPGVDTGNPMVPSVRMTKALPDPNHPVFSRLAPTGTIIPLEVIFNWEGRRPKKIDINK